VEWLGDKFRRITGPVFTREGQENLLAMIASEDDMPIRRIVEEANKPQYWK